MSHTRAMKLHKAKPENGGDIFQQYTFTYARCVPQVTQNIGDGQTQEIIKIEMRFGVYLPQGHRFTAVTVVHSARRFVVDVNNLGFRYVCDGMSLFLRPLCPGQILQTCQRFIIIILLPQTFSDRCVGVIAKGGLLI